MPKNDIFVVILVCKVRHVGLPEFDHGRAIIFPNRLTAYPV